MEVGTPNKVDRLESAFADHQDGNLFCQLADAYREAGDHERALGVLRKGLEKHASHLPGYVLLGRILIEQGRFPEALVTYERVLEIDPVNSDARQALDTIMGQLKSPGPGLTTDQEPGSAIRESAPGAGLTGSEPVSVQAPIPEDAMPWDEPTTRYGQGRNEPGVRESG